MIISQATYYKVSSFFIFHREFTLLFLYLVSIYTHNYTNYNSFCFLKTKNEMNNHVFCNVYSGLIIFKVLKN